MGWENPTAGERQQILRETRTLAMVGASPNPARASNFVATYLLSTSSYEVWFVNPNATEILGRPVYPSPADLPGAPDLVDVFRRLEDILAVPDDVLERRHVLAPVRPLRRDAGQAGGGGGAHGGDGPLRQGRARPLPRRPAPGGLRHRRDHVPAEVMSPSTHTAWGRRTPRAMCVSPTRCA